MSRATIRWSGDLTISCASTARTVRNTDARHGLPLDAGIGRPPERGARDATESLSIATWMLARFQAQPEQYPAPWISQKQRLLQDRNQPRLLAQLNPCRSPRRSTSASTIRPIRHSAPSSLSIVARSHEADLIHPWRADSLAFVWLDPEITSCCKSPFALVLKNSKGYGRAFHVKM